MGTTLVTSPVSNASAAPNISAVRINSRALPLPMMRGNLCVPPSEGIKPDATSGKPKRACGAAILISQASAISKPPPSAWPLIAATTGLPCSSSWRSTFFIAMLPTRAMRWVEGLAAFGPCQVIASNLYWPPTQFQRFDQLGVNYRKGTPERIGE